MAYMTRYRLIYTLLLTALLAGGSITSMAQTTGVRVKGNVYGGGNLADVKTNTAVNMSTGTVEKNVFGGGKGKADNFTCDKAMVGIGINDDGVTLVSGTGENAIYTLKDGGTTVTITNGRVKGDVYGGGEIGRVERNTIVTIGEEGNTTLTPIVEGHVFGAGKGLETHGYSALVRGNATVTIQGQAEVWQNVHGGGEKASVGRYYVAQTQPDADAYHVRIGMPCYLKAGGKCTVNILDGATIGKEVNTGDVYGAGQGIKPDYRETDDAVTGKKRSKRMMPHVEYASGIGHNPDDEGTTWDYYVDDEGHQDTRYVWEYFTGSTGPNDYLLFVETLARASETDVVIGGKRVDASTITTSSGSPTVKGTVYGGSESGFVYYGTLVNIPNGTVKGDAFGGGKGLDSYSEAGRVRRNTNLTVNGGTVEGNVYGGGSLGDVGYITKNFTNYNHTWKQNNGETPNASHNNSPSAPATNTGVCNVTISNGSTIGINGTVSSEHGNVFGAGKGKDDTWWCEKAMVFATNVNVSGASTKVYGSVFGGGEIGRVEDDAKVTIGTSGGSDAPNITGSVFGAGKGLATHGYSALLRGNTEVTVQGGATVGHSVYGGGEIATVGRYVVVNGVPTEPDGGGDCTVTIKDNAEIAEDVFGAGQGVDPTTYRASGEDRSKRMMVYDSGRDYAGGPYEWEYITTYGTSYDGPKYVWEYFTEAQYRTFLETLALASDTEVEIGGTSGKTTKVNGSVYGGSESGFLQRHTQVTIKDYCEIGTTSGTTGGNVFGGGKGLAGYDAGGRVSGYTDVTISGGTMYGSVYGGGENGIVKGGVKVNMNGGTVNKDVYGGGALADTNTGNGSDYIAVPEIPSNPKNAGLYEKTYVSAGSGTAVAGTTYYEYKDGKHVVKSVAVGDPLTDLYVVEYTSTTNETVVANKAYYTQTHPTTVNLLGGTIKGDAYGGGLGQKTGFYNSQNQIAGSDIPAVVNGDIYVNLGSNGSSTATSFYTIYDNAGTTDKPIQVIKSGRIFGCNNLLGSPQGDVTVTVWRTVAGNGGTKVRTTAAAKASNKTIKENYPDDYESHGYVTPTYEVAAVYGGGNLAPYETVGKKTHVIINGCDLTSIETVYGGGNAAAVPETAVDVNSCYEIGSLFGGGNGKDKYKKGNTWTTNLGANVNGNANTLIYGGTVHEAYGGSNEKGTITGNVTIDIADSGLDPDDPNYCEQNVEKLVGAGKNADVNGDLKIIMGCKPETKIPLVYGGADNANVNGNVELTITSGNFGKVFGGNNDGGSIKGHIFLNIEETTCIPINIDHLYLCGNNAAYSQYGYYVKTTQTEAGTGIGDPDNEIAELTDAGKIQLVPRESADDTHKAVKKYEYDESGGVSWEVYSGDEGDKCEYPAPNLNVISCTSIGEVFGGGYGEDATVYGNPKVNINMIPGAHADEIDRNGVTGNNHALGAIGAVYGGGDAAAVHGNTTVNVGTATTVDVYEFAQVSGEWKLQYGTDGVTPKMHTENVEGAYITGNLYGGGKLADVTGNTYVNVCAEQVAVLDANDEPTGEYTYNIVNITGTDYQGVIIGGNVYGGGEGYAKMEAGTAGEAFLCAKAMIGVDGEGIAHPNGGTNVVIANGTVAGNVYGGGKVGRVEKNTKVTIGIGEGTGTSEAASTPVIEGNVFGAGAGVDTHGYSALVRGTSTVLVEGDAKVLGSVYGGGEKASVGRYKVVDGLPQALNNASAPTSGYCYVTIRGYAEIGPDDMEMTKDGGPSDAGHVFGACQGVLPYDGVNDGVQPFHMNGQQVLDANGKWDGKSWEDEEKKYPVYNANAVLDAGYAKFIKSLALATQTEVTISGNPFIKGSVYGGSENGYVQYDTHVTISGGQIGNGYVQMKDDGTNLDTKRSVNRRYTAKEWADGRLFAESDPDYTAGTDTELEGLVSPDASTHYYTSSLPECASWPYGENIGTAESPQMIYAPYDKFAQTTSGNEEKYEGGSTTHGGRRMGSDGHTFYGNVFGGGSGYYPYKPGRWFEDAGAVYGNTYLTITGGHILTSVYGGNEMTDVGKYDANDNLKLVSGGTCYVTMIGGTIGVPRTLGQIQAHPVTCYLFGAGKGDQRVFFNKSTNVGNAVIHISDDARIYGSVLGGGEDGHVMKDVTLNIGGTVLPTAVSGNSALTSVFTGVSLVGSKTVDEVNYPYIGTWGTSYVDGNVFGGGRGFGGDAYTAGNVAGSVTMKIMGGSILGSVYGGGRLGSVGYGLFDAKTTSGADMPGYGEMRPDNTTESYSGSSGSLANFKRGYVDIEISGGTIGNDHEYLYVAPNTSAADLATLKTNNYMPNTEFELVKDANNNDVYRLKHTKGGNVFAGGMGRRLQLDNSTPISSIDWMKLGNVKQTKLKITGGTIKSNVYGGGELGAVTHANGSTTEGGKTEIEISGTAIIGSEVKETVTIPATDTTPASTQNIVRYTFGSVYGAGMGSEDDTSTEEKIGGRVEGSTKISMSGGTVNASVYGGGELAVVQGSHTIKDYEDNTKTVNVGTEINISAGTIGYDQDGFGGATMGNVYGAGKGSLNTPKAGLIMNNTRIKITGSPTIYHNIYGGGAYASVGTFTFDTNGPTITNETTGTGKAEVIIEGGTIGINGHENGMIFGSSRGDVAKPDASTEKDPNNKLAWVLDTHVVIGTKDSNTGPQIRGSVYGSGENGHVLNNTTVDIHSGTIGIDNDTQKAFDITSNGVTYNGAEYPSRGNVYGGGCGTDTYSITTDTGDDAGTKYYFNPTAGIVRGNATINMDGGKVVRAIYGGGAMGSIGKYHRKTATTTNLYVPEPMESCEPNTGLCTINISRGQVGPDNLKANLDAGNVFGAGRGEIHNTVEYPNLERLVYTNNTIVNVSGTADVKGSVYGGGETGNVLNNTEVNVCAQKQTSGTTVTYTATSGTPTIGGNVYGGGKGSADNFKCDKAMVGLVDQGVDEDNNLQPGGTTVRIFNGTVTGNVYGGGEIARVERNTVVEIGAATGTTAPTIQGSVFAAGAGLETHGYSALVRGTSTVTVQGSAKVKKNVYGGGEKASVGRYKVKIADGNPDDAPDDLPNGMPYGLKAGGISYVVIQGNAEIGTANVATTGHVYGAGQGVEPGNYDFVSEDDYSGEGKYKIDEHQPKRMIGNNTWEYFGSESAYHQYLETLAISASTDVTINGTKTTGYNVMGSVFGGSESGFVYQNTDVKIQGGTVKGDAFGGGRGLASFAEAGRVRWNTNLAVSGGTVEGNVYGGGNLGDVGTIYKPTGSYDYIWRNTDANGNNMDEDHNNTSGNNTIVVTDENPNTNTGICTVTISGGTIGIDDPSDKTKHGNVFGAGEGLATTFWCEKAIAFATNVSISGASTTVKGNVYGGGEVGRIEDDVKVMVGTASASDAPSITGSVFGGGAGVETHGYSALVRGNTKVNVEGRASVGHSVYGGGEIASVGKYGLDKDKMPSILKGGGYCYVTVQGNATITDDVFGAGEGVKSHFDNSNSDRSKRSRRMTVYSNSDDFPDGKQYPASGYTWEYYEDYPGGYAGPKFVWDYLQDGPAYSTYLETLALATHPEVTIDGTASISGSVFGGGELGLTKGSVIVNIQGGTIAEDVYGGGSLADTNTTTKADLNNDGTLEDYSPTTTVKLKSGTINRNVYGGGLGQLAKDAVAEVLYTAEDAEVIAGTKQEGDVKTPGVAAQSAIPAKVYGEVLVELNKPVTTTQTTGEGEGASSTSTTTYGDCVVKGAIFGCNNLNGSPQKDVTVHVYKTQGWTEGTGDNVVSHDVSAGKNSTNPTKNTGVYELTAVYGGGNLAAYYPDGATTSSTAKANVIIDGCKLTSIRSVYGGGNAASAPATEVTVNGTYEIGEVFGGGNGKDSYQIDGKTYENPGANVGYKSYAYHTWNATPDPGQYVVSEYTSSDGAGKDASTKEKREANYAYGTGKTQVNIYGGTVHSIYGGSNSKGNVRVASVALLDGEAVAEGDDDYCPFDVDEAYGGGKNADMDGTATLIMSCINGLSEVYGGAKDADVNSDVSLTITNGTYGQVFGGNNVGGRISGAITVNVEETGCKPVIIGELYGGGNKACYSIYGYKDSGRKDEDGKTIWLPFKAGDAATTVGGVTYTPQTEATKYGNPVVNVHSFTSIGTIYGGGYGETAVMVGSPTVNVDVYEGRYYNDTKSVINPNAKVVGATVKYSGEGYDKGYPIPTHTKGDIGAINTIFGGGNAAEVVGNTTVNIGTHTGEELDEYEKVPDADITVGTTDVSSYYTYSSASYTAASGTAVEGTTYYQKTGDVYSVVEIAAGSEIGADCYTLTSEAGYTAATGKAAADTTYYWKKTVKGADIRGNVYGGGNNAPVTGDTNVVIGKQATE